MTSLASVEPRLCMVQGCEKPRRKFDWCDRHYAAWRRHGDPTFAKYHWAEKRDGCVLCAAPALAGKYRKYCSAACAQAARRGRDAAPWVERYCLSCGDAYRLYRENGKFNRRTDQRYCDRCKPNNGRRIRKHGNRLAVELLAHYQGAVCGICAQPVDMTRKYPDAYAPTIDHIVPLSLGGADAADNIRLAHSLCNGSRVRAYLTP